MTVNMPQVTKQIQFGVAKQYREANRTRLEAVMQEIENPLDISRHIRSEMTADELAIHYARALSYLLERNNRRLDEVYEREPFGQEHYDINGRAIALLHENSHIPDIIDWEILAHESIEHDRDIAALR